MAGPGTPTLAVVVGSTNYAFDLARAPLLVRAKPRTGEVQRLTGKLVRDDILDTPVAISRFTGLGLSRNTEVGTPNFRLWDAQNIISYFDGFLACLGPKKQTPTWTGGPTTFKALGNGFTKTSDAVVWMHGSGAAVTDEPLWFLDGTTWTSATVNADVAGEFDTCSGIVQIGNTYHAMSRDSSLSGGFRKWMVQSTDKTTWSYRHTPGSNEDAGLGDFAAYFLAAIEDSVNGVRLYFVAHNPNTAFHLYRTFPGGANGWTAVAASFAEEGADSPPRGMVKFSDSAGVEDIFVGTKTALYWIDISASTAREVVRFRDPSSAQTGRLWLDEVNGRIMFLDGDNVGWGKWDGTEFVRGYLGPDSLDDARIPWSGLPTRKIGATTAGCPSAFRPWSYVAKGGLAASRFAWIGLQDSKYGEWHCPYQHVTAQRAIMAIIEAGDTLHILEEQAAGGDQDPFFFANITRNPSTTASYPHAATGSVVLAKDDRLLPELNGVWRNVGAVGSGLSSTNKITDIFASADAAPLDMGGSWGTTLGEITATAGTQNFVGTPTGTGQSARAMQLRIDLEGASDASPYIEQLTVSVVKLVPTKYVRRYLVDIEKSARGTVRPAQLVKEDLEAIVAAATDLNVTFGEEDAIVMEPWWGGAEGPLTYEDLPSAPGTVKDKFGAKVAVLTLVEV